MYALDITSLWIADTKSPIIFHICNSQLVDQLQKFTGPDLSVDEDEVVERPEMIFCQYEISWALALWVNVTKVRQRSNLAL